MAVKYFLAGVEYFDRPSGEPGQMRHAEFEIKGLALAAKCTAEGRLNDANAMGGDF